LAAFLLALTDPAHRPALRWPCGRRRAGIRISRARIGMGLHCPVQRSVLDTRSESALQTSNVGRSRSSS